MPAQSAHPHLSVVAFPSPHALRPLRLLSPVLSAVLSTTKVPILFWDVTHLDKVGAAEIVQNHPSAGSVLATFHRKNKTL
jgi:hypothetical protein